MKESAFLQIFEREHLVSTLVDSRRFIGAFAVAGAIIGVGLIFLVTPQWEAVTVLQVGQTDTGGPVPTPIEPTSRAVERMKLTEFRANAFQSVGIPPNGGEDKAGATTLHNAVKVVLLRNADLIQLTARGFSPEQASNIAAAYEKTLANYHEKLAAPAINRMRSELKDLEVDLSTEIARRDQIQKMLGNLRNGLGANRFSENVLLVQMSADNVRQLRTLESRRIALLEQLDPYRTFNTHAVGAIDVSEGPIYPRKVFFLAGGLLVGAALAFAGLLLKSLAGAGRAENCS